MGGQKSIKKEKIVKMLVVIVLLLSSINTHVYAETGLNEPWAGRTGVIGNGVLIGSMELNTYHMDNFSTTKIQLTIKHEFGHTLGCDENSCSEFNIMYPYIKYSNINLTIHDKASVYLARKSW